MSTPAYDPLHCPRNRTGTSLHRCELATASRAADIKARAGAAK